jgi:rhamnosyltransferase
MNDPLVSIILRSFNEGWALRGTLAAIRAQEYRHWELIAFDSGSADGSMDLILKAQPRHFIQLQPHEYVPGRVMNQGMRLAQSNFCIFLNADATPQGESWLRPLVNALTNSKTAAAFGRQIPRPDCRAVYACDYERCFGVKRESSRWEHFFSMVSSGVRKDIWGDRGFSERLQYAEDDEYTRWCKAHGYAVVYCPDSVVMHSHNYTASQAYKRSFGDAKALAACWRGKRDDFSWPRTVLLGWLSDLRHDLSFCWRTGRMREFSAAAAVRWHQRRGKLQGFRDGWALYRGRAG